MAFKLEKREAWKFFYSGTYISLTKIPPNKHTFSFKSNVIQTFMMGGLWNGLFETFIKIVTKYVL